MKRGFKLINQKLHEVDILKGMAFLALVLQHTIAGIFYQPDINGTALIIGTTLLGLTRFAIPLFMFIMGFILFQQYSSKLNFKVYYKTGLIKVIVPYVAWTIFYFIWTSLLNGSAPLDTFEQIKTILNLIISGEAIYHLWYMIIIITFYLLFPVFKMSISNERNLVTNSIVLIVSLIINLLLLQALSSGVIKSDNPKLGIIFNYLDRNILFWHFYFLFGGFVGIYYDKIKTLLGKIVIPILILIAVSMYFVYSEIAEINSNLNINYISSANVTSTLKPFTMILCTLLIISLLYIAKELPLKSRRLTNMFATAGRYAFGAFFVHPFTLSLSNTYVFTNLHSITFQTIVSFALCSSISVYISYLLNKAKTPVGRIFTGKTD